MPVRQLSDPSVSASASSSSETVTSTTRGSGTVGESASGAVGSSTTISISDSDMSVSLSGFGDYFVERYQKSPSSSAKADDPVFRVASCDRENPEYWMPRFRTA